MFPEYRDLISQLKTSDRHFLSVFNRHNEIDQQIKNMESKIEPATHQQIDELKRQKLALKDELHDILRRASSPA